LTSIDPDKKQKSFSAKDAKDAKKIKIKIKRFLSAEDAENAELSLISVASKVPKGHPAPKIVSREVNQNILASLASFAFKSTPSPTNGNSRLSDTPNLSVFFCEFCVLSVKQTPFPYVDNPRSHDSPA
jgi:hypothetical protein